MYVAILAQWSELLRVLNASAITLFGSLLPSDDAMYAIGAYRIVIFGGFAVKWVNYCFRISLPSCHARGSVGVRPTWKWHWSEDSRPRMMKVRIIDLSAKISSAIRLLR